MYNMQILLKPSIKTTCSEWYGGVGPYFVFLCICSGHLSRHCFCQAIAVAVNRSAAERYVAGVSPLRLTFSQLFPSDFRRPLALRYRQAKGWGGYIFYWSSFGKVGLVFELTQFCVKQSNQTLAGSERINDSKVDGPRRQESIAINKSLSHLGDVINAIQKKSQSVLRA